jgi:hypothetical protein
MIYFEFFFSVHEYALDALFPPVLIIKYPERGKGNEKKRLTKHETFSSRRSTFAGRLMEGN